MKVYAKIRKKLICVSVGLFTVCLFFAFIMSPYTRAKYIFEASDPEAEIEISVQNQIEITSVEQFKTAIENGYSNIQIADAVASPLLFLGDELDLKADLVIDLNGHELQRTGSDAMVNVPEGITLTIYDSDSTDPNSLASLYNPVGSVIDVTGGNLSLVGGKVESGVRANEYSTEESAAARGSVSGELTATLYTKYVKDSTGSVTKSEAYQEVEDATLPKISAATITSGNYTLTDGNIYVPAGQTLSAATAYTFDTNNPLSGDGDYYLYYMNESNTYTAVSSGSADFYYEYRIETGTDTDGNAITEKITVCGFYRNFDKADSDDTTYAAIRMENGKLNVFGGEYYQYFGVDNNYCVYATGGDMTVYGGAFVAEGYSTCLGCNFTGTQASGTLKVKAGGFTSYLGDGIRVSGYAGSMTDTDDMTVTGGKFTKIADKAISVGGQTAQSLGEGYDSNGSAINMVSGKLTVQGAGDQSQDDLIQFNIYGGGVNGIKCGAGAFIDSTDAEFLFNCNYDGTAQNSSGGSTVDDAFTHNIGILNYAGNVAAENNLFRLNTAYNVGIYSTADELFTERYGTDAADQKASGEVTVTSSMFSMTGEKSVGVLATRGTVTLGSEDHLDEVGKDRYAMFYIDRVTDCFGVYVAGVNTIADVGTKERGKIDTSSGTGDTAIVNSYAAQFYLGQTGYKITAEADAPEYYTSNGSVTDQRLFNSCGIYMNSNGNGSVVNIGRTMIFSAGSYTAGIFVRSGEVAQKPINGKAYKFAALMGIRVENYGAGGQYDDTIDTEKDHSAGGVDGHYRDKFGMTWYVAQYGADNYTAQQLFDVEQANAKGCYGINTLGGTIKMYNCYLGIYSTWSSGIYSLGGNVYIYGYDTADDGEVDSGLDCKVITFGATSSGNEANDTANADIAANTSLSSPYGSWHGTYEKSRLITSCVVRMGNNDTSSDKGFVYVGAGQIYTDNYGFYIDGGDLTFGSDESLSGITNTSATTEITSYRAPAIVLNGGSVTLSADDTLTITDTLNDASVSGVSWTDFTEDGTIQTDGIYVSDGDFIASGTLNIKFTGLENDTDYTNFFDETIKSYAIRISSGIFKATGSMNVSNSVGGGVAVVGGDVQLGAKDSTGTITVETTGNTVTNSTYYDVGSISSGWSKYKSKVGGHAVTVKGGNLVVYSGTYTAAHGNGIYVWETSSDYVALGPNQITKGSDTSSASVTVYGGTFTGNQNSNGQTDNTYKTGPGAYYGLKVIGNATVKIYGGSYDGGNGGAFITGMNRITSVTETTSSGRPGQTTTTTTYYGCLGGKATVYVYAGVFGASGKATDGINIYDSVTAYLGAYSESELNKNYGTVADKADSIAKSLTVNATGYSLAVNPFFYGDSYRVASNVYVYYGTYGGTLAYIDTSGYVSAGTVTLYNSSANGISNPLTNYNSLSKSETVANQTAYVYCNS